MDVVTRDRTDLLDTVRHRLLGRAAQGLASAAFPDSSTFHRWLPRQQEAYPAMLAHAECLGIGGFECPARYATFCLEARVYAGRIPETGFDALKLRLDLP